MITPEMFAIKNVDDDNSAYDVDYWRNCEFSADDPNLRKLCQNYADAIEDYLKNGSQVDANISDSDKKRGNVVFSQAAYIKRLRQALLNIHALAFRADGVSGIRDICEEALLNDGSHD